MFDLILGSNADTFATTAYTGDTLREVLDRNDISYDTGAVHYDGSPIRPGDLDKTFADLGANPDKKHSLVIIKKLNNAR